MKKIVYSFFATVITLAACNKADLTTYQTNDNIYFDLDPAGNRDSILYTFAYYPDRLQDTVFVPVRISGIRVDQNRSYKVKVIDSATTAIANQHYEPFKDSYVLPAGAGSAALPVVLFNNDPELVNRSFAITIELVPTEDFGADLKQIITARIVFSNKLEKPKWWEMWLGAYYSQVKHQLFRLAATTEDLSMNGLDAPKNLYYINNLQALLDNAAVWVSNNPDKGYVLEARPDGNFDFYYSGTPEKKLLYRKNTSSGKFYFIDENGNEVI
jgi:hypothetical protein